MTLFLFFDFSALALNAWLSKKIEKQAVAINLAGRQRMLTQRLAKVLLELEDGRIGLAGSGAPGADLKPLFNELQSTLSLFDDTLRGFAFGHLTRGGSDEALFLEAVNGEASRRLVADALETWEPYRALIEAVLQSGPEGLKRTLPNAAAYSKMNNLVLLGLMNRLTSELERTTRREAAQIRLYQEIAFLLALVNFAGAFILYGRRLREASKYHGLLDEIINKVSASVMVLDENGQLILKANQTSEKLFGYSIGELTDKPVDELLSARGESLLGLRKDGTSFHVRAVRNEAVLEGKRIYIETVSDVTEQHLTEQRLSELAYYDLLTRLPNRLLFDNCLQVEIAHAQRRKLCLAVLFIDLDCFKPVNDTYGHDVGDLLLQEVAVRLKGCLRQSDTISRRGGDEFTAIINDIGARDHCSKVAQLIIKQIAKPFLIKGLTLKVGASMGIALFPEDGAEAHDLLAHADEAMYASKQQGRGCYRYYSQLASRDIL